MAHLHVNKTHVRRKGFALDLALKQRLKATRKYCPTEPSTGMLMVCFLIVNSIHDPQIDVYSYGVLICEMCTGETPNPKERKKQVDLVRHQKARELIDSCTREDPGKRFTMSEVINALDTIED